MSDNLLAAFVAILGSLVVCGLQFIVSKYVFRMETKRLQDRLLSEFHREQFTTWQCRLQDVLSELLAEVDPQRVKCSDRDKVIQLVMKAQLMLDPMCDKHRVVHNIVTALAMDKTGWNGFVDSSRMLKLQAALVEEARKIFYLPTNNKL